MAHKLDSKYVDNNLGIKVEGELDDFQIIEEETDSDDDYRKDSSNNVIDVLPSIPPSLVKPASTPIGNVAVTHSENVIIGNNTYFNGPVVIKQVIQNSSGVENPGYVKTDDDEGHSGNQNKENKSDRSVRSFHIQRWHKVTFSAVCLVVFGGVFAIVSIVVSRNSHDDSYPTSSFNQEDSSDKTDFTKVVGMCYDKFNIIFVYIIICTPLTLLLTFYTFVMFNGWWGNGNVLSNINKKKAKEPDDVDPYRRPPNKDVPVLIAPGHLRIVPRTEWLAQPVENKLDSIRQPVPWVIISHTATESCSIQSECVYRVRLIQMFHIESRKWDDIGYNFLVAGDGSAYFGRGWDYIGAHTLGYNKYSIGISFIGTFNNDPPPKKQLDACVKLLRRGVELGKLAKDYKLFAHRQLASTLSPGDKLYDIIKEWPHFVKNFTDISELLPNY